MHFISYEQVNNTGKNTFAFIHSLCEIGFVSMQKITELQLTFVSTQVDNALEQIKLLCNFESAYHLLSADSGNVPVARIDRRLSTATAPKDKTGRRKIRKRN